MKDFPLIRSGKAAVIGALLLAVPVIAATVLHMRKQSAERHQDLREKGSALNACAQENIAANRVVKAFAREDFEAGIVDIEDDTWERAMLCPMVDARRMEVYTQLFNGRGEALSEVEAKVIDEQSFAEEIAAAEEFVIFGNGAAKCAGTLSEKAKLVEVSP